MNTNFRTYTKQLLSALLGIVLMASCNKDVEAPTPLAPAPSTATQTLADLLNDPNFSVLKAAATKANLLPLLSGNSTTYTIFAPTNAALALSGITEAVVQALPASQLETILRYHIVGGQQITADTILRRSPNLQLPSLFSLAAPSAALPPGLRMSIFPSGRGNSFWVNNIPITGAGVQATNGILYPTAALVAPPSTTIKGILASNPAKFSILLAALQRADSAQTGLNRLDSVINFAPANLTFFAPNNDAFRALFPPGTPDAVIIGAINTPALFKAEDVRGLAAYHLLGNRYFSVNFTPGTSTVNTLLVIPGTTTPVPVITISNLPTLMVKDVRPTSTPATVVTKDLHAINGVVHEIDKVLLPR